MFKKVLVDKKEYEELKEQVRDLEFMLFEDDFISMIDNTGSRKRIVKADAMSFEVVVSPMGRCLSEPSEKLKYVATKYTAKHNYENHKARIDKWAEEVKQFKAKQNGKK